MSDTVIVVQDECILVAVGKAGRPPKVQKVERIPLNGFGESNRTLERSTD